MKLRRNRQKLGNKILTKSNIKVQRIQKAIKIDQTSENQIESASNKTMNSESTTQVQGQESVSILDTTTLQNQSVDTSNIKLENSEVDKITQDCSLDRIENMTSSIEISKPEQSTVKQSSYEVKVNKYVYVTDLSAK